MYRSLMYVSRKSLLLVDVEATIADIVRVSSDRNPAVDLTGALASAGKYFIQYLEGPGLALDTLMHSIEIDKRHTDLIVLKEKVVLERILPNWSMAYCGSSSYVTRQIESVLFSPDLGDGVRVSRLRSLLVGLAKDQSPVDRAPRP